LSEPLRGLRPGETRILSGLAGGAKGYNDLQKETGLGGKVFPIYLKNLQRQGYIERGIEDRKYRLLQKSLTSFPEFRILGMEVFRDLMLGLINDLDNLRAIKGKRRRRQLFSAYLTRQLALVQLRIVMGLAEAVPRKERGLLEPQVERLVRTTLEPWLKMLTFFAWGLGREGGLAVKRIMKDSYREAKKAWRRSERIL